MKKQEQASQLDILEQKANSLLTRSNSTYQSFAFIADDIDKVNQDLSQQINEVDTVIGRLQSLRKVLNDEYEANRKLADSIAKLTPAITREGEM
jgi:butyrate kinase